MRKFLARSRKHTIDWKCGASTILFYLCLMWLIVLAVVLFVQLSVAFQGASKSQLFSDVLADGSAYIGNNGWGLNEEDAESAYTQLSSFNKEAISGNVFDEIEEGQIGYAYTDSDGENVEKTKSDGTPEYNTVLANATWSSNTISGTAESLSQKNASATRITYSGGMRIVLEAWHHTFQYWDEMGASDPTAQQTWYIWGGGHNGDDDEWKTYADCSGFVTGVYRECGYNVPEYCTGQLEFMGTTVGDAPGGTDAAFKDAMPGDVILYWYGGTSDGGSAHTGIYAGYYNGKHWMVHCSGGHGNSSVASAGKGGTNGAILAEIHLNNYSRIKVNRIVDSDAQTTEIDDSLVNIPGLVGDESTIYWDLRSFGYGHAATAAFIGCMHGEGQGHSWKIEGYYGDTPSAVELDYMTRAQNHLLEYDEFVWSNPAGGNTGYGIAQWSTVTDSNGRRDGTRKINLWNHSIDGDVSNIYAQLRTLESEMSSTYASLDAYLRNLPDYADQSTIDEATKQVMLTFEGIMNGSLSDRQAYANQAYRAIQNY